MVELLNNAQTNPNDNERIESLKIVQETVLHKVIYFPVMFTGVYILHGIQNKWLEVKKNVKIKKTETFFPFPPPPPPPFLKNIYFGE